MAGAKKQANLSASRACWQGRLRHFRSKRSNAANSIRSCTATDFSWLNLLVQFSTASASVRRQRSHALFQAAHRSRIDAACAVSRVHASEPQCLVFTDAYASVHGSKYQIRNVNAWHMSQTASARKTQIKKQKNKQTNHNQQQQAKKKQPHADRKQRQNSIFV